MIVLNHNGPTGLGDAPESACGKDWRPIGGDYGDPDLREAIAATNHKNISLVTFGHMHHNLRHRTDRIRDRLVQDDRGMTYLNAAAVPRVKRLNETTAHQFSVVEFDAGQIQQVQSVWLTPEGQVHSEETVLTNLGQPVQSPLTT